MVGKAQLMSKPNIILICADQFRGDCLGIAGHPDVKTPFLDTLATRGVYFPHAYSACPTCVPARAVLHTGRTPYHTGRLGYQDGVEWCYRDTLASCLAAGGYHCVNVGKMHVYPPRRRMGFHEVRLHDGFLHHERHCDRLYGEAQERYDDYAQDLLRALGRHEGVLDGVADSNSWVQHAWPHDEALHPTNWVVDHCLDVLRRHDRSEPLFLMASFVRPHPPYDAPQAYVDFYRARDLAKPATGDWDDLESLQKYGRIQNSHTGPVDPELIHEERAAYYACITHLDHQLGRLFKGFEMADILDDSVIIFCSDHGEMLSDHALARKSLPYQGSIHIPLILSGSERYLGPTWRRDERLVELMDIMPTCLALAGLPCPDSVDGLSLLSQEGEEVQEGEKCQAEREQPGRQILHGEHTYGWGLSHHFIVTRQDKYIWFSETGREQYFRLDRDPMESQNLVLDPDSQARIADLRQSLIETLKDRPEGFVKNGQLQKGSCAWTVHPHATAP